MKASDNVFPKVLLNVASYTTNPAAGSVALYAKSTGIFYRDSSGNEHAVGSGGGGGGGVYAGCRAVDSTNQAVSSTSHAITFNTNVYDTNAYHSTSVNPSRFTIPAGFGGKYLVDFKAVFTVAGQNIAFLQKNGVASSVPGSSVKTTAADGVSNSVVIDLADGDYLELWVFASAGGNVGLSTDAGIYTSFGLTQLTGAVVPVAAIPVSLQLAASDEGTALTTGTRKVTFRMPYAMTLTAVRASLTTAASTGLSTFDVKMNGTSLLSTLVTVDATEKTSTTAVAAPVISTSALTDDAEITVDITGIGTGATGLKISLIGTKP